MTRASDRAKPMQFRIKHLLIATFAFALAARAAPSVFAVVSQWRDALEVSTAVLAAFAARWFGWRVHWPPGRIGRHAIAFFCGTAGCALMIVLLNYTYTDSGARLMRAIADGFLAGTLIYAILIAGVIETVCCMLYCTQKASPTDCSR